MSSHAHKNRKMPYSAEVQTDGKFDKEKFISLAPDAASAISSGETSIHEVSIKADSKGKPTIQVHRAHSHKKGLDPSISLALQNVLLAAVEDGSLVIGEMSETDAGQDQADVLTIKAA